MITQLFSEEGNEENNRCPFSQPLTMELGSLKREALF